MVMIRIIVICLIGKPSGMLASFVRGGLKLLGHPVC
jgi:hypothetical protein